jgi:hypothetical protein
LAKAQDALAGFSVEGGARALQAVPLHPALDAHSLHFADVTQSGAAAEDDPVRIFVFKEGGVVAWGLKDVECSEVLAALGPAVIGPHHPDLVEQVGTASLSKFHSAFRLGFLGFPILGLLAKKLLGLTRTHTLCPDPHASAPVPMFTLQ